MENLTIFEDVKDKDEEDFNGFWVQSMLVKRKTLKRYEWGNMSE